MRAILLLILLYCSSSIGIIVNATESPEDAQTKAKRTLSHHLGTPGDSYSKPMYYSDNVPAQTVNSNIESPNSGNVYVKSFPFPTAPVKTVFGPEVPTKVAAQQVLYEFQQTPTNAVSNVHVKQLFQPLNNDPTNLNPSNAEASESVATPVQHSAYTNHGQNYAQVSFNPHPLYNIQPHHVQQQHYIPGKYLYINGRMVYQPNQHNQNQNQNQNPLSYNNFNSNPNPAYLQNQQKLPVVNFANRYPIPQQRQLPSITTAAPIVYGKFTPPTKLQSITSPMNYQSTTAAPIENEEQNEEEEDEDNARIQDEEAEEDDGEEGNHSQSERYDEEDDERQDRHPHFGRYSFDEDEEPERYEKYRNDDEEAEEDEEDSRRGSSRVVPSKARKQSPKKGKKGHPDKYNKSYKTNYSEGYSTSSKYEHPGKGKKKIVKSKPKKTARYSNKKSHKGGIEGRYSEHVPVTHKHKLFKENKWYVTQNTNDKRDEE